MVLQKQCVDLAIVGCSVDTRKEAVENNLGQIVGSQNDKALSVELFEFYIQSIESLEMLSRTYQDENGF